VVFDLVSFLVHVQLHRVDLLWSFHKVHHSTLAAISTA
jgi:sterol desaturase/sphingolipid hydroxylase (fatty acid hydroxylase superfamily)